MSNGQQCLKLGHSLRTQHSFVFVQISLDLNFFLFFQSFPSLFVVAFFGIFNEKPKQNKLCAFGFSIELKLCASLCAMERKMLKSVGKAK